MELDEVDGGAEIQAELLKMTGQRTVPNIFIKGTFQSITISNKERYFLISSCIVYCMYFSFGPFRLDAIQEQHLGGCDDTMKALAEGRVQKMLE